MPESTLYINGAWVASSDGEVREIRSPHDNSVVSIVSEATAADTRDAIKAARESFDSGVYASWSMKDRCALVEKVADLIKRDAEILAAFETGDTGKRMIETRYDMADIEATFRHFAALGLKLKDRKVDVGAKNITSVITHEPVGVCALIGPWNYPLLQISWKVAPALVAGCSFIIKPSELSPSTAIHLMKLLEAAGLPKGVANLICGAGATAGAPLTEDPRVDLVSFTGGLITGRRIMATAAQTVKKVALELGGKNPHIIFENSNIDAAIDNAVTGAFLHSGQVCSAGTRVLVEKSIHDRVVTEIVRRAKAIYVGGPDDSRTETGPLISKEHLAKVEAYMQDAVKDGATVLVGGARINREDLNKGWYFPPTVIDNCLSKMKCVQDESFGPIMTIETFESVDEAIALGNDTIYGLSGAVWCEDKKIANRVAGALRHGTIWVNDFGPYRPQAEWGGFKASGVGRELGEAGLDEYLEIKHIWTNNEPARSGWFADPK